MTEDEAFLNKLLELPADDNTRLIYADWLDERGDPLSQRRAQYLRLISTADADPREIAKLANQLGTRWLMIVSKPPIESCPQQAKSNNCPGTWADVAPTEQPGVRLCTTCGQPVRWCESVAEALRGNGRGTLPVVVNPAERRKLGDLQTPIQRLRHWANYQRTFQHPPQIAPPKQRRNQHETPNVDE